MSAWTTPSTLRTSSFAVYRQSRAVASERSHWQRRWRPRARSSRRRCRGRIWPEQDGIGGDPGTLATIGTSFGGPSGPPQASSRLVRVLPEYPHPGLEREADEARACTWTVAQLDGLNSATSDGYRDSHCAVMTGSWAGVMVRRADVVAPRARAGLTPQPIGGAPAKPPVFFRVTGVWLQPGTAAPSVRLGCVDGRACGVRLKPDTDPETRHRPLKSANTPSPSSLRRVPSACRSGRTRRGSPGCR